MLPFKILVVDDDAFVRSVLVAVLADAGAAEIRSCATGDEALVTAKDFTPDLVILDLLMPGRDGASTWQALRAFLPPATRAIFVSARPEAAPPLPDVLGVLSKPFNPATLAADIARLLNVRGVVSDGAQRLARLAVEYRAALPETLQSMTGLWRELTAGWNTVTAEALRTRAHNIAGTAGLFGLHDLGNAANRTERLLLDGLKFSAPVDLGQLGEAVASLLAACTMATRYDA